MTTANAHGHIPEIGLPQRSYLARDMAGMTQTELAEAMGVSRRTVVNVENGEGNPRRPTLAAWALATGVPMEWLETGKAPTGDDPDGGNTTHGLGIKSPKLYQLSYRGTEHDSNVHDLFPRRAAA